jgi:hypothetical protein
MSLPVIRLSAAAVVALMTSAVASAVMMTLLIAPPLFVPINQDSDRPGVELLAQNVRSVVEQRPRG